MKSYDVLGFTSDGAIYCPDCIDCAPCLAGDCEDHGAVFADDAHCGDTCDTCHAEIIEDCGDCSTCSADDESRSNGPRAYGRKES